MTPADLVREALAIYQPFTDEPPRLVPTGLEVIDRRLGGLSPGNVMVVGALYGVGKSSLNLACMRRAGLAGFPHGRLSLEDPPDLDGVRLLSDLSGVDSLRIRRKQLSEYDRGRLREAQATLERIPMHFQYALGKPLGATLDALRALVGAGARAVWVDYPQALPGSEEPATLGRYLTEIHGVAADLGVPVIFLSQLTERMDPRTGEMLVRPRMSWLRGSGNLAIKARAGILLWPEAGRIAGELAKSTFGGGGLRFWLERDESGTLREVTIDAPPEW